VFGLLGIWLAAASAAAINHVLDQRIDALMARTHDRPLPTGGLRTSQAVAFALTLGVASMAILVLLVNTICALLTFLLADRLRDRLHRLPQACDAAEHRDRRHRRRRAAAARLVGGHRHARRWDWPHALLLVLIIFLWTPPHFWALAIFRREDYAKAMIPMLPVTHGVTYTRWQILFYTVLLVVATMLPRVIEMSGNFYLGGAIVLGAVFLWYAWKLLDPPDEFFAMKTFQYSIVYLMALFAFLLIDHWLLQFLQPAPGMHFQPVA
jgi:protoheme IX farnesyltransferase